MYSIVELRELGFAPPFPYKLYKPLPKSGFKFPESCTHVQFQRLPLCIKLFYDFEVPLGDDHPLISQLVDA